jgi:hypothetical protein
VLVGLSGSIAWNEWRLRQTGTAASAM